MKLLSILTILLFSFCAWSKSSPYRPPAKAMNDGAYEFDLVGSHFTQSAVFDYDGNEVEQSEGSSFSESNLNLLGRYSYGKSLHFFAGISFRQNSSTNGSTNEELTSSGVERVLGGAHYSFDPIGHWYYALEFSFAKTAYSNQFYPVGQALPSELVLGDDGQIVEGLLHMTYSKTRTSFYSLSVGLRMPQDHLAMEIPWKFEATWIFDRWAIIGGVKGITSMGDDEFTDSPTSKPRLPTGVTGLYNSINREMMEPFIGATRAFDSWKLGIGYSQVISGISTDKGQTLLASLSWSSEGVTTAQKRLNTFKEYDTEATVNKVSPRGTFVKIDKGLTSDIEKGMRFDIFKTDFEGGNKLYASGIVYETGSEWSIIKITQTYQSDVIQNGFTARGYRQ